MFFSNTHWPQLTLTSPLTAVARREKISIGVAMLFDFKLMICLSLF